MARRSILRRNPLSHFVPANKGSAAVEFAMIAFPFFMLLFGVLELGFIFMLSTTLDNALTETARRIRTGEFQTGGSATAANFKNSVCGSLGWLQDDCGSKLFVDVRTFPTFTDVVVDNQVKDGALDTAAMTFVPGGPEDIVLVRAYYQWDLFAPGLNLGLESLSGGKSLITATATFRNEPYE